MADLDDDTIVVDPPGMVVAVVPARKPPRSVYPAFNHYGSRDHVSYIVKVELPEARRAKPTVYWPIASKLMRVRKAKP